VLRLANFNSDPFELEPFAREVERASRGRLRIEFANAWRRGESDAEAGVLDDVRDGRVDLAWVGARAFRAEGVSAFDALIAPFEVTDYATERRVLTSPVARTMLDAVGAAGVMGVAVLPGPLQWLGLREPWRTAADLSGKRIGAPAGIGADALRALGATTVAVPSGGELDGIDGHVQHLDSLLGNHYARTIPYIATEAFWARALVVVAGPRVWQGLSSAERGALRQAGVQAVDPMLDWIRESERSAVPKLCRQGARFFAADLPSLRRAVEPVYRALRSDPATAASLAAIEELRSPRPDGPLACRPADEPAAALPSGTYAWSISREEALRVSGIESEPEFLAGLPATFRAVIERDHIVLYVSNRDVSEDIGLEADISRFKDRVAFDEGPGPDVTARWSLEDGNLRFTDVRARDRGSVVVMGTKPWRRTR
jgi:TRAP-type C4-dicarboxylate transport system substrate-binding protein